MKGESLKEIIFNTFKIKYELIDKQLLEKQIEMESDVAIYFNMDSILERFFNRNVIETDPINKENYMNLTAYVLNMLIHYRRYITRKKLKSEIFILWGDVSKSMSTVTDFSLLSNCIITNMRLIEQLCPFIPGVYFVNTTQYHHNGCVMHYLINRSPDKFHWVITKDVLDLQTLGTYRKNSRNILVTYLKYDKKNKENTSLFIYDRYIYNALYELYGCRNSKTLISCKWLDELRSSACLIPFFYLTCTNKYMMKKSFSKVIDTLYKNRVNIYVGMVIDIERYEGLKLVYTEEEIAKMKDIGGDTFIGKAYVLSNIPMMVGLFNPADEHGILSGIYDLQNKSLEEVNSIPHMEKRLYVDVEDLIKGGDIKYVGKKERIKW
ncbi:MAG: hypothetical protein ACRCXX_05820 [Cetobacterium sp.]|uniref:hypothetical protein n=1 Tax=Cetobacterium sp. TaxID=2071632 RepID=UPI003F37413F